LEVLPENRYQSADDFRQTLLSARSISRRHDELLVEPPPVPEDSPEVDENQENGIAAGESEQAKPRMQAGARLTIIILSAVIIVLLGIIALTRDVFFRPSWAADFSRMMYQVSQATPGTPVAWYAPWLGGVSISIARATPTGAVEVSPTPTSTLTPSPTRNSSPTPTAAFTSTPTLTLTVTPVPTQLGGGGGQVAFASQRSGMSQIYVVNMDGSGLIKITDLQDGACQPSWSPDGKQLVFTSPCDGNQEFYPGAALFIINADGTGLAPLPSVFGGDFDPAWSPDGKKIAFTSMRDNGRTGIYVFTLDSQSVEVISSKYGRDRQPYWSADGSEIIFVSDREGNSQIWVMSADGSNQRRFSETPDRINLHPSWSPDQKLVLFTQFLAEGSIPQLAVATYGIQPYQEYKMILEQSPMRDGRFSPDGYWVAYEGWPAGNNHDIYIMTLNGSERQALATNPALDYDPSWKPIP
jgi:dipeptidyl aminopeptidase/acylaminoacyl peptidase